ncbi:MAG: aminoacyl-tRNA hydrolase [Deltaproteobacteria bacterium]|nr:aminoacyl-tRNA hydrolase [Deltaproteobacteria bacterium]
MFLVAGLGNPGARYDRTRHNIGFDVVERVADRAGIALREKRFKALLGSGRVSGESTVLCKPQTFMNRSGDSVGPMAGWYKLPPDEVIVVHDDLDLPFGDVRVKVGGGHGGHNGLRDLNRALPNNGYVRVRVGIGRPPPQMDVAGYVLSRWTPEEAAQLDVIVDRAVDAVELVLADGAKPAMNRVNGDAKARRKQNEPKSGEKASASADAAPRGETNVGS